MPLPHILKIVEIFPSLQGEGLRQGEPTLFIRLAGCNLRCSFCDTAYAWGQGQEMPVPRILEHVLKIQKTHPAEWVCVTGGEPLLQDLGPLLRALKKEKFRIQVETNATHFRPYPVDWYSVSPKPPDYVIRPEYAFKAREVKLVVTKDLDIHILQRIRQAFPEKTPILLQPQSNRKWSTQKAWRLLWHAAEANLRNLRVSCQLHKVFGWR